MKEVFSLIDESNKILVMTHESPDGDAVGSAMAIYHMLLDKGKDVYVLIPEVPHTFEYLNGIHDVIKISDKEYDLAIVVDTASIPRIGQVNNEFSHCRKSLVIDHHISNTGYGTVNYVLGDVASCCEVIYYLYRMAGINISNDIGEALMTGSLTDTNGFRNNNVDKNTFLMAAELFEQGVNIYNIYKLSLARKTLAQYALIKMAIDRLELLCDGKIAFSYISLEDMENVGARKGDHEGLVDFGRNIEGVEVSIFVREDDGYRVSFRSNGKIDVNVIASRLGGGGHKMAAGLKINNMSFKETKDLLINETLKELSK